MSGPRKGGTRSAFKKGNNADNPDRIKRANDTSKRDKSTIKRLNMYRGGKPIRDKKGKIIGGDFMDKTKAGNVKIDATTGRIAPDRRWFGNTRVISQTQLDKFRDAMATKASDPYKVVLRSKTLPLGLLTDTTSAKRASLLTAESFRDTFGPTKKRKRVNLNATDLEELATTASASTNAFVANNEELSSSSAVRASGGGLATDAAAAAGIGPSITGEREEARAPIFDKGTSKRIWGELYKVLDCSDVVVQVLDARDPMGSRSPLVEKHLKENARHKQLIFVLNKVDLVPTWVTRRWVASLSREYPTLAFHASKVTKSFGKGSMISLLRQLSRLHSDKKSISVGFIGYPNVGKSSVINALKGAKSCKVAPVPGETKVWQYVNLMKRVFMIDCPGVVSDSTSKSDVDLVLRGVVRAERLLSPELFVQPILDRLKREHIFATYGIRSWDNAEHFLEQLAVRQGRLLKGGEPDVASCAVNVINDWQRGKLPYFSMPPEIPIAERRQIKAQNLTDGLEMPKQVIKRIGRHELLKGEERPEEDAAEAESMSEGEQAEEELDMDSETEAADGSAEQEKAETSTGSKRGRKEEKKDAQETGKVTKKPKKSKLAALANDFLSASIRNAAPLSELTSNTATDEPVDFDNLDM